MKNNRFDEILNAGFGDHEGNLGELTVSERRELEQAKAMKEGLKALKEVPEHQLSNDRLRNAILGQAVKPRRSVFWSYAGATAMVAVVGFIALKLVSPDNVRPQVASNSGHEVQGGSAPEDVDAVGGNTSSDSVGQSNMKRETIVAAADTNDGSPDLGYTAVDALVMEPEYRANMEEGLAPTLQNASLVEAPAIESASMSGPVVVVESGSTTPNGAAMAREVESYGNVVFGG